MNKTQKRRFYLTYTVCFALLAGLVVFLFYSQGRTMVDYGGDGFRQHYRALVYYASFLKQIISNFLHGNFVIPQWDFAIAEGNDIIQTFHYYCLGDIFTLFSVFFPLDRMYLYYDFATLLRMYTAGLAFSWLCFYKQKNDFYGVLTGTLLYAFSEYALIFMTTHVFFISAMVFLPLIILGVEKILNDDKPYIFALAVCLSALSNIYFFYMNVLSTAIYVAIRTLMMEGGLKEKADHFLKICLYSVLGLLMSFVITLPMLDMILSGSRLQSAIISSPFYSLNELKGMFSVFVYDTKNYYGCYTVVALLAVLYLFFDRESSRQLKVMFVVGVTMAFIPFFGKLYNAMIYPTGRWVYALTLLICYIVVDQFAKLIKDRQDLIVVGCGIVYSLLSIYLEKDFWQIKAMFIVVMIAYVTALFVIRKRDLCAIMCVLLAIFCITFEIMYDYSFIGWKLSDNGTSISRIAEMANDEHYLFDDSNESFFRYSGDDIDTNQGIHGEVSSTQYYWSLANNNVIEYRKVMGLSDHNNHHYDYYDDRFGLNALAGVRYYVLSGDLVPTGFSYLKSQNGYEIYESQNALPLVYGYDTYMARADFDRLGVVEKNEAILQTAVIEKASELAGEESLVKDSIDLEYTMSFAGLDVSDDVITVNENGAVLTLEAKYDRPGEYYFVMEGLYSDVDANIKVSHDDVRKTLYFKGPYHSAYGDKHDFIINIGCLDKLDSPLEITFPNAGIYTFKSIRVVYVDTAKQMERIHKLNDVVILDMEITDNRVISDLQTDKDQILCFSIPYSKGWRAYVDGERVDAFSCNIAYTGLELDKDIHHVELVYSTPLLKAGALISIGAWMVFISLYLKKGNYNKIR